MQLKKGDTIIEVCFAIAVYSLVAVLTIALMNVGTNTAQGSLEVTMARNEMDAQAEAIRFIHNSYLSERELVKDKQVYKNLWKKLANQDFAIEPENVPALTSMSCKDTIAEAKDKKPFIINTRSISPTEINNTVISLRNNNNNLLQESPLHPRVIFSNGSATENNSGEQLVESGQYNKVARVEGLWVFAVSGKSSEERNTYRDKTEYFDFHIRACWYGPGKDYPSTIGTIIRLYNPEIVEVTK